MKLYYEVIVTDRHGKVILRENRESRSWVMAYNQLVYGGMSGSGQSVKCTDGVNRTQSTTYDLLLVAHPAGYDKRGCVVGGGDAPVTINDYRLDSQINHGAGPGQLEHYECTIIYPPSVGGSQCTFRVKRIFHNASGGPVTVREIGVYGSISNPYDACVIRDVLGAGAPVPHGGAITAIYTVRAIA
ncbi:MAG: hypothetical protein U1B77_00190 [Dehalococcoidales bacterium]|nr:hypothetical protein [Dehalococcoidales bacterium]